MAETGGMTVDVLADRPALFRRGAELFAAAFTTSVSDRSRFTVALSGGTTPKGLFELLARPPFGGALPWPKAHVFWGDERCVPPEHADSNYRMAREALLSKVAVPANQIRRIRGELAPDEAAADYEAELRSFFGADPRFDLALLGLGVEGHTASLFPGSPALSSTSWVAAPFVEKLAARRVTLTPRVFNRARSVLFLAAGADKREAVDSTLNARSTPAASIRPEDGELVWLLDSEAGADYRASERK